MRIKGENVGTRGSRPSPQITLHLEEDCSSFQDSRVQDDVAGQKPTAFLSTWISLSLASHACGLGHSHTKPHQATPATSVTP